MTEIDCCITTMNRPQALERLLLSIAEHWPDASVHVADQSEEFDAEAHTMLAERLLRAGLHRQPTVHRLPFDCGVSVARNFLVEATPSEYKFVVDDDGVFTEQTDIYSLAKLLDAHPQAGAVSGTVARHGRVANLGSRLVKQRRALLQVADTAPYEELNGMRFKRVDCLPNCTMMRSALLAHVRWDPALKTAAEHFDFYLRVKETPFTVLYMPDVIGEHPPLPVDPGYTELRWRAEFVKRMMAKHDLERLQILDGTVLELRPDGELVKYPKGGPEAPFKPV